MTTIPFDLTNITFSDVPGPADEWRQEAILEHGPYTLRLTLETDLDYWECLEPGESLEGCECYAISAQVELAGGLLGQGASLGGILVEPGDPNGYVAECARDVAAEACDVGEGAHSALLELLKLKRHILDVRIEAVRAAGQSW